MTAEGKIKQCSIVLTRDCNLRCTFCYVKSAGYVADNRIEYDDLKSIVNFCCEAKVKYILYRRRTAYIPTSSGNFAVYQNKTSSHNNCSCNKWCLA